MGKHLLHMFIKGEIIKGLLIFMIFVKMSSYPLEFLSFSESYFFLLWRCKANLYL